MKTTTALSLLAAAIVYDLIILSTKLEPTRQNPAFGYNAPGRTEYACTEGTPTCASG